MRWRVTAWVIAAVYSLALPPMHGWPSAWPWTAATRASDQAAARSSALITGASSGIGRAIAVEAAQRGFDLVVVARQGGALRALCAELASVRCVPIVLDLAHERGVEKLRKATRSLPPPTLVVANAGVPWAGPLVEQPVDQLDRLLALNVNAVARMARLYGADLAAAGRGALLFTASLTALAPLPGAALYAASRAFVHSLAESVRLELAPRGVTVTALLPGATDTGFASAGHIEDALIFNFPLARLSGLVSQPADVARMALDGVAAHAHVVTPGLLNCAYGWASRLMPRALAARFSKAVFCESLPSGSLGALLHALPVLAPGALFVLLGLWLELSVSPLALIVGRRAAEGLLLLDLGLEFLSLVALAIAYKRSLRLARHRAAVEVGIPNGIPVVAGRSSVGLGRL